MASMTMGIRRYPSWLDRQALLNEWGKSFSEKRKNYRHFVESRLLVVITDLEEKAAARAVSGSEVFVDRMQRAIEEPHS